MTTRSALDRAHLPPTMVFQRLKTTCRCFDSTQYQYVGFSRCNKIPHCSAYDSKARYRFCLRVAVHTLCEKAIQFWHPDYDQDRAQKLIRLSMSRHLSTRNISSKSMHVFLSNLAHRQTDKWMREKTYISSVVGGKQHHLTVTSCWELFQSIKSVWPKN